MSDREADLLRRLQAFCAKKLTQPSGDSKEPPLFVESGNPGSECACGKITLTRFDSMNFLDLGLYCMDNHAEPEKSRRVLALIQRAADAGNKPAALALGEIYWLQRGPQQSLWKAVGWWSKSVPVRLLTDSQIKLSDVLANGEQGVTIPSPADADIKGLLHAIARHYRREDFFNGQQLPNRMLKSFGYRAGLTCISILWDSGDLNACYHLALIYLQGKGVVPNPKKGTALLKSAAERGHQKAIVILAAGFTCGLFGISPNKEMGLKLMALALQQLTTAASAMTGQTSLTND